MTLFESNYVKTSYPGVRVGGTWRSLLILGSSEVVVDDVVGGGEDLLLEENLNFVMGFSREI